MRVIHANKELNSLDDLNFGIFLAGPCTRTNDELSKTDWREDFISKLESKGYNGDVIDPTNEEYDENDPDYLTKQTLWEHENMFISSVVVFWLDRHFPNIPALTSNIEFGLFAFNRNKRIIVGCPEGADKNTYIEVLCNSYDIPCYKTMDEIIDNIMEYYNREPKTFFIADTHFTSDRTLELSKRPFLDVDKMDNNLISNWNSKITNNDIVYHLGDVGNYNMLKYLNYKELHILEGNYERDDKHIDYGETIDYDDGHKKVVLHSKPFIINIPSIGNVLLQHEPIIPDGLYDKLYKVDFHLYGHAHFNKICCNGYNVGVDCNNYVPVDIETIEFFKNAIDNHYDMNVFTNGCS